jgi:hypothetical protein
MAVCMKFLLPLLFIVLQIPLTGAAFDTSTPPIRELLNQFRFSGFSFISDDSRAKIHDLLEEMDQLHLEALGRKVAEPSLQVQALSGETIGHLSTSLPKSEKILLLILKRQEGFLSDYLADSANNQTPKGKVQNKRRVLRQKDRIFHHYGDVYYTELITIIRNISSFQAQISPWCKETVTLEKALQIPKEEIEKFVIDELHTLTKNATILHDYIDRKAD